jgi:hypothetical protein
MTECFSWGEIMSNATPIRTVRVGDKLWKAAKAKAKRDDTTVSEVINRTARVSPRNNKKTPATWFAQVTGSLCLC